MGSCAEAVCVCMLSHFSLVRFFATLWPVALQAPLSMGFSRQESWSGLPRLPSGDLPNPGIKPMSHVSCVGRWVLYQERHLEAPQKLCRGVTLEDGKGGGVSIIGESAR